MNLETFKNNQEVQAIQFDGSSSMIEDFDIQNSKDYQGIPPRTYLIKTKNGLSKLRITDWIVQLKTGQMAVVSDGIFRSHFDLVQE